MANCLKILSVDLVEAGIAGGDRGQFAAGIDYRARKLRPEIVGRLDAERAAVDGHSLDARHSGNRRSEIYAGRFDANDV